jgi:hypothetical protein
MILPHIALNIEVKFPYSVPFSFHLHASIPYLAVCTYVCTYPCPLNPNPNSIRTQRSPVGLTALRPSKHAKPFSRRVFSKTEPTTGSLAPAPGLIHQPYQTQTARFEQEKKERKTVPTPGTTPTPPANPALQHTGYIHTILPYEAV